ncbi:MAG: ATP-binding protein [Bacteroidales bacterium]
MPKPVHHNRKRNLYLIASLVIWVLAFLSGRYYLQDFDQVSSAKQIQETIHEKDQQLSKSIKKLNAIHITGRDTLFAIPTHLQTGFTTDDFVFVIREADSVIFWSDNRVPLDFLSDKTFHGLVQTGNGWYRHLMLYDSIYSYSGLYLIRHDYNYQNEYLVNDFHSSFGLECKAKIHTEQEKGFPIRDENGYYLFSVEFQPESELTNKQLAVLFILYLGGLLFFIGFIYEVYLFIYRKSAKRLLFLVGFILDLLIIRALIFYFKFPAILHDSVLFGPRFYAFSDFIPSIGDLFLHALFILLISFFFFKHVKFFFGNLRRTAFSRLFISFSLFIHVFIFFGGLIFLYHSLVIDSNISLDLNNIFSLSWMSLFSFLILATGILAFVLITVRLCYFSWMYLRGLQEYALLSALVFVMFLTLCFIRGECDHFFTIFLFIFIVSLGVLFHFRQKKFTLSNSVFIIIAFSIISTYALHKSNNFKEREYRILLAEHLASEQRDPLAEFMFGELMVKALADDTLRLQLQKYGTPDFDEQALEKYFFKNYFTGYWKKYDHQLTICHSEDILIIQPEEVPVNCFLFFENMTGTIGEQTQAGNLYFMNYGRDDNGYVAIFSYQTADGGRVKVFVELMTKYLAKDLGFPDLLIDEEVTPDPDFSDYSYAKFQDGELYKRVGKYFYNFQLEHYGVVNSQFRFFDQNGFNHLYYNVDSEFSVLISRKHKSWLDLLAPFSYFFIAFSVFIGLIFLLFIYPFSHRKMELSFRTRLQISMSAVILFSFIVIGIFTIWYINNLNDEKNKDILSEKTHSVLVEMQHKFSDLEAFNEEHQFYLSELLSKFSNVFFTDINIFNLNGTLTASSRPQIFQEMLISRRMNPEAFYELKYKNSSLFIHDESIGKQQYLSAYIPFVNDRNQVMAYLNLPYFAKENDLKREISSFLVAYINIYVILIAFSILIALVISNYISRPLKLIMQKIRMVKLGGQNEKISWDRRDEIGQLVIEYNRMIDELATSAELLARSERETAWREMAKQVAHEIKNPLTPMKLSVQYLQRSWKESRPDWEQRLDKFTKTMIDQIETLSAIATEFSDFAKMPLSKKEDIDVCDVLHNSISLFKHYENIDINLHYPPDCDFMVYADKEQLLRAFNNLLKNSIQAIGDKPDGRINISLNKILNHIHISIQDNGGGIPSELSDKIFSPNFTTKSGGMGLGLAIVKNVITLSGGDISFHSDEGSGTTFKIILPVSY